ncbi:flagellar export chaperone FliS [Spongiibacter marinus]|uniref:flagellar export chaperone FliS n=1 Tax=Spongiibacter marinus TaxID=354246 RepID=UPI003C41B5B3
MSYSAGRVSQAYASVGTHSQVEAASPHRLIQLLMDGALDRLALARGQIQRGEISLKANSISRTMSIIDGLRLSLDHSVDSSLSENLEGLYDYMNRRLLLANVKNDTEALDEVSGLLRELKGAWDAIPDPSRESAAYSAGEAVV